MPAGRTHDRITFWTFPLILLIALDRTRSPWFTLVLTVGYLLGGVMLSPDLDIHSHPYKRWGWLRWIWLPYRASIGHRSPLSHAPIIGTTLRVLYLAFWMGLMGIVGVAITNDLILGSLTWDKLDFIIRSFIRQHGITGLFLIIGLELGAMSHSLADFSVTHYKRIKERGICAILSKKSNHPRNRKR